jgi:hypothetical protein
MNHFRRIFAAVATLAGAVLAVAGATAALATRVPPPGGDSGTRLAPPPTPVRVIAESGMPGWQITLIAVAAAVVAATMAVIVDRARAARRHLPAPTT